MSAETQATTTTDVESSCWCCGRTFEPAEMVNLGSHPEVTVCFRCAAYLHRRARAREDAERPSLGARARGAVGQGREYVIAHGWHRNPVLGPPLRWLGDHLP